MTGNKAGSASMLRPTRPTGTLSSRRRHSFRDSTVSSKLPMVLRCPESRTSLGPGSLFVSCRCSVAPGDQSRCALKMRRRPEGAAATARRLDPVKLRQPPCVAFGRDPRTSLASTLQLPELGGG